MILKKSFEYADLVLNNHFSQLTLKTVVLLNISVKTMIDFLQDSLANIKLKARRLFEIEIFCMFLLSSFIKLMHRSWIKKSKQILLAPNIKAVLNKYTVINSNYTSKLCLSFYRAFGVERGHNREFVVGFLSSAAVCSGSGLLQLSNETTPSLQLSGHSIFCRCSGLPGPP